MSRKPSKPETRIEDYLDVMAGGNAVLSQPELRIEFYYAFLAGMAVELPQPILDDEKLLAKICGMEVEAPTYIPELSPRLYAYMAKKGGQDVQVPDPILRLERYWYDYSAGEAPSVQEYTGAVPVTFIADGTPLLDLLISGNEEHNGTPTPDSPIMPQGTGERTGNLWSNRGFSATTITSNNSHIISNNYGTTLSTTEGDEVTITQSAYPTGNVGYQNGFFMIDVDFSKYAVGDVVTISFDYIVNEIHALSTQTSTTVYAGKNSNTVPATLSSGDWKISGRFTAVITIIADMNPYVEVRLCGNSITVKNIMLNAGSTALPYEPYGYKIPISSANTTTPVYLGEVESTRKIKKLVFDGSEPWVFSGNIIYINNTDTERLSPLICTHFPNVQNTGMWNGNNWVFQVNISNLGMTGRDAWKTYLQQQYAAGTPVTVWYVLANEETGIVNESLMKISTYADTLSMEQAGAQIPTANGSTTLDVETTVKPSEIYIKYRGEAVATLSMLSAEVSSPEANEEENPEEMEEEENEC